MTDYERGWRDGVEAAAAVFDRDAKDRDFLTQQDRARARYIAERIRDLATPGTAIHPVNNSAEALNCEGQRQTHDKLCPECGGDGACRRMHMTEKLRTLSCDGPCETCGGSGRVER